MTEKKTIRHSGIELLRMLAGMAVVILHFNFAPSGGGALEAAGGFNRSLLLILENLCICAVNLFILISGYFNCLSRKTKPGKLILLILQTIVTSFVILMAGSMLSGEQPDSGRIVFSLLPVNYYVILYCATMLLAPFINRMLESLSEKGRKALIGTAFGLFSVIACGVEVLQEATGREYVGLSPVGIAGASAGYTVVNFLLIYLAGAGLKCFIESLRRIPAWALSVLLAACVGGLYAWRTVLPGTAWMYCNPLVIAEAALLFLLFERLKFQSRIINRIAPASFTCFLIHEEVLSRLDTAAIGRQSPPAMIGTLLLILLGTFGISFLVMLVWNLITKVIFGNSLDRIPPVSAE